MVLGRSNIKRLPRDLGEKGVISQGLSKELYKMGGYRNRLVHFYREVTSEELYEVVTSHLEDFERFSKEIVSFIKAYEKRKS